MEGEYRHHPSRGRLYMLDDAASRKSGNDDALRRCGRCTSPHKLCGKSVPRKKAEKKMLLSDPGTVNLFIFVSFHNLALLSSRHLRSTYHSWILDLGSWPPTIPRNIIFLTDRSISSTASLIQRRRRTFIVYGELFVPLPLCLLSTVMMKRAGTRYAGAGAVVSALIVYHKNKKISGKEGHRRCHRRTPLVLHSRSTTLKLQRHKARSSITPRDGHRRTPLVLHRSTTPKLQRYMSRSSITPRDGHRRTPLLLHSRSTMPKLQRHMSRSSITPRNGLRLYAIGTTQVHDAEASTTYGTLVDHAKRRPPTYTIGTIQ